MRCKFLLRVLLGFAVFNAGTAVSIPAESPCTINKMQQSPIASTALYAATYELEVFCKRDAIAMASIPKKLQSGAEIQVAIADMFGHNAVAGKTLAVKKGQSTMFFTVTSFIKPAPNKYKFMVDITFYL